MSDFEIKSLKFSKRPISIPADYRPMYKIAQIVMILSITCTGSKSSLLKLHLLSWALKNDKNKDEVLELIKNNYVEEMTVWGIEPALNRALLFCVAEDICKIEGGKYLLTEKGKSFFKLIKKNNVFNEELEFLNFVGKRTITDNRIESISNKWSLFNVEN
ncbi:hypothetical protein [uncultured Flavobacterium sp.]|uniref:hypothetical protein n=1 Tax=uncultured Flavobacterium sp. TaxID=165435 RepID=UPI0025CF6FD7|nr:hypothetical protein [uncultured Flavobacterium sp.]